MRILITRVSTPLLFPQACTLRYNVRKLQPTAFDHHVNQWPTTIARTVISKIGDRLAPTRRVGHTQSRQFVSVNLARAHSHTHTQPETTTGGRKRNTSRAPSAQNVSSSSLRTANTSAAARQSQRTHPDTLVHTHTHTPKLPQFDIKVRPAASDSTSPIGMCAHVNVCAIARGLRQD